VPESRQCAGIHCLQGVIAGGEICLWEAVNFSDRLEGLAETMMDFATTPNGARLELAWKFRTSKTIVHGPFNPGEADLAKKRTEVRRF